MCSCSKKRPAATTKYLVLYPDGRTETKTSEMAAKLSAGQVPGATWTVQDK
jgi:hypothetical protein